MFILFHQLSALAMNLTARNQTGATKVTVTFYVLGSATSNSLISKLATTRFDIIKSLHNLNHIISTTRSYHLLLLQNISTPNIVLIYIYNEVIVITYLLHRRPPCGQQSWSGWYSSSTIIFQETSSHVYGYPGGYSRR